MAPPTLELADIFRQYGPAYRQAHSLPLHQHRLMHAIETCRTEALGGVVEWVRPLPIHTHPLSLLPQPPLPQVSGTGTGKVVRAAPRRVIARGILSRGLHSPRAHRLHRLLQPRRRLRHSLPRHCRDPAHHRPRPPTSGRGNRLLCSAPYLGSKSSLSSPSALCGSQRRLVDRSRTLDRRPPPPIPFSGQSPQPLVPAAVAGSLRKSSCRRQTPVLRRSGAAARPASLRPLSGAAPQKPMGSLRQGPLWRTTTRAGVSGPLFPSRGHFQSPPADAGRWPSLLPVERLPGRTAAEGDDRLRR